VSVRIAEQWLVINLKSVGMVKETDEAELRTKSQIKSLTVGTESAVNVKNDEEQCGRRKEGRCDDKTKEE
jgi:hypothetical protein